MVGFVFVHILPFGILLFHYSEERKISSLEKISSVSLVMKYWYLPLINPSTGITRLTLTRFVLLVSLINI